MIDFVELVNQVARIAKPAHPNFNGVKSMNDKFKDTGIDSLDGLLVMIYLSIIYGVPEELSKHWYPITVQELFDLLMAHKTKEPSSIEEAIAEVK
jgi:hypothetical protein